MLILREISCYPNKWRSA